MINQRLPITILVVIRTMLNMPMDLGAPQPMGNLLPLIQVPHPLHMAILHSMRPKSWTGSPPMSGDSKLVKE